MQEFLSAVISCIGAANIDIKAQAGKKLILGSSNPVRTSWTAGGVARNISENLVRMGAKVQLVSRVGSDANGKQLLQSMREQGIGLDGVSVSQTLPTATYTAILESNGEMLIATADMDIYDELTPEGLAALDPLLKNSKLWVVDSNLSAAVLEELGVRKSRESNVTQLWVVAVSVAKTRRILSALPHLTGMILNQDEFFALMQSGPETPDTRVLDQPGQGSLTPQYLQEASSQLFAKGLQVLIVTCGSKGVYLATPTQLLFFEIQPLSQVADVTGAGDAFSAGVILGLSRGHALEQAIGFGVGAARMTLSTLDTVHPQLSIERLLDQLKLECYKVVKFA